jgi:hypothetical protein
MTAIAIGTSFLYGSAAYRDFPDCRPSNSSMSRVAEAAGGIKKPSFMPPA